MEQDELDDRECIKSSSCVEKMVEREISWDNDAESESIWYIHKDNLFVLHTKSSKFPQAYVRLTRNEGKCVLFDTF